ncbi:hypothetical protein NVP1055O_22 [Vibrio phage 1.055.O._10N.286.55.E9]|nr:hypothetical protein NVP1055O_22 [Vibrio phage 1.055.O._10N.286.55.E9]
MADKEKTVSVVLDHDNVWVDDVHYVGKRGETIQVSPRNAKQMKEHGFIKTEGAK